MDGMCADTLTMATVEGGMQATAFDGLFGYLHRPAGAAFDTGVVIVAPLGRDARCAHTPMRLFADQLAAAGFPVLRYDHRGEGDSLPFGDPLGDASPMWRRDVRAAMAQLRAQTGVRRVVLAGARIGATFAALAAEAADGLILLAPVLNGRSWLRRMQFSAHCVKEAQAIDFSGLHLAAATVTGLSTLTVDCAGAPRRPIFVAAQNKLVRDCAVRLAADGAPVSVHDFPGFDALFEDAHSNLPPWEVFTAAHRWLEAQFADHIPVAQPADALDAVPAELRPAGAVERAITFGAGLHGVVCTPDRADPTRPAVVFCNTGGDPRAGIGGFAAAAARALAQRGTASLRFDFRGLGDSAMADPAERPHVYETPREQDLDAALAAMGRLGHHGVLLVGICSGAYHAVRFAARDPRVEGVFAISPVKLVWRAGDSLVFGRRDDGKSTESYMQLLRNPATWLRLLRGGIDLPVIARNLLGRLQVRLQTVKERLAGVSPLGGLRELSRRGGRAHFVMGTDDIALDEIGAWFGPRGARLTRLPGMTVAVDPRLDHGLARCQSRDIVLEQLVAWATG